MKYNLRKYGAFSDSNGKFTSALIFAGQDTTSNAMSHALHSLAMKQDVQNRLRKEVLQAKEDNGGQELGYDTLIALPYLDAIFRETLRMYPPSAIVWRQCVLFLRVTPQTINYANSMH